MEKTIKIPKGYEARIEGNEVIFELKESEDERIRKSLIKSFTNQHPANFPTVDGFTREQIIAYLEKQKEQNLEEIEDKAVRKYMELDKFALANMLAERDKTNAEATEAFEDIEEQKPTEWSEQDERNLYNTIEAIKYSFDVSEGSGGWFLINWLKYRLRLQNTI